MVMVAFGKRMQKCNGGVGGWSPEESEGGDLPPSTVIYIAIKYHCVLHANSRSLKLYGLVVITIFIISIACIPQLLKAGKVHMIFLYHSCFLINGGKLVA